MPLSKYQQYDLDWTKLETDLSVVPFFRRCELNKQDIYQKIELSNVPWNKIVSYPTYLKLTNNDYDLIKYINNHRANLQLKPLPLHTRVTTGSYSSINGRIDMDVTLTLNLQEYCGPLRILDNEFPPLEITGKNFLCHIGLHKYEKDADIEIIEHTRIEPSFFDRWFSNWIKVGIKRCRRCSKKQYVIKQNKGPWKKTTKETYQKVLSYQSIWGD